MSSVVSNRCHGDSRQYVIDFLQITKACQMQRSKREILMNPICRIERKAIIKKHTDVISLINCRGGVVNTPASYSGGPGFKSRPTDRLF
jgi:hypothetical protein